MELTSNIAFSSLKQDVGGNINIMKTPYDHVFTVRKSVYKAPLRSPPPPPILKCSLLTDSKRALKACDRSRRKYGSLWAGYVILSLCLCSATGS